MTSKWPIARVGDISEIVTRGISPAYDELGKVQVINQRCIRGGRVLGEFARRHDPAKKAVPENKFVKKDDILINSTGVGTVGRSALVSDEVKFGEQTVDSHVTIVRSMKSKVDPRFLHMAFVAFEPLIVSKAQGSGGQVELSRLEISNLEIPLPPLDEQKRIVAKLDQALGYVDELDASIGQRTASIFDLRKSFIRSTHASVSDWSFRTLPELSTNLDSLRIPITKSSRIAGEVPYYGASGVVDYVKESIFDEDLLLISEDGANLLARSTAIAFSISGPSWVNNHAHVLRFENLVDQKYVEHYLESINIDDFVSGAAQPKLNQASLNKIPIPWPNELAARRQIVQRIEDAIRLTSEHHEALIAAKIETTQLRSSVLASAFAGDF